MDNKLVGEAAERRFSAECMDRGMVTSKPDSDNIRYDVIVDNGNSLIKVQIKCTTVEASDKRKPGLPVHYRFNTSSRLKKTAYTKDDCDFIVCYVKPINRWYIFPIEMCNRITMRVYPNSDHENNTFKEAWQLLKTY